MAGTSAILTAAGESTRMGRPKPLLPWAGTTLIEYQISNLAEAGASQIVVVLGHKADIVAPHVKGPGVRLVRNSDYRQGKTTSIKTGLRAVDAGADDILLLAVDQPRTTRVIAEIVEAHVQSGALITSPRYRGHGGHPLIFSSKLRREIEGIAEEGEGIRAVFRVHRDEVSALELDDSMVRLDLNTPESYERAKALYGA